MEQEAAEIRRLVRSRAGLRYSPALRARIERYVRRRRLEGASQSTVSREVGVKWSTLRRWEVRADGSASALVPVTVATTTSEMSAPTIVSLVTPSGYRLEGLDARDAFALFRAL